MDSLSNLSNNKDENKVQVYEWDGGQEFGFQQRRTDRIYDEIHGKKFY